MFVSKLLGTASQSAAVGHGAVAVAVGPLGDRIAAEVKTGCLGSPYGQRQASGASAMTFSAVVGPGSARVAASLGLFWRRLAEEGSGRLRFGAAVFPRRDSDGGGLLNLGNCHHPRGQQAKHDVDSRGDAAIAALPAPDAPWADAKQLGDAVLCDAECAECRAEFGRGH